MESGGEKGGKKKKKRRKTRKKEEEGKKEEEEEEDRERVKNSGYATIYSFSSFIVQRPLTSFVACC